MGDSLLSWKIILIIIVVIIIGGLVAASTIGWLNLGGILQKWPLLADMIGSDAKQKISLEEENDRLKKQVAEQAKEIKNLEAEVKLLRQLEQDLAENKAQQEVKAAEENMRRENYRELAAYYAEMEPEAAVAIFDNLEEGATAIILQAMPKDQAGKILEAMDPEQAAGLLKIMAELEPFEET